MSVATQRTVELLPLFFRADIASYDPEARTVEMLFSTGAGVERYDWMSGKRYIEKLSMEPKAIRLDRLNAGAPLLDSHSSWSVGDVLGAVVPGTARVEKGKALATVRFSARDEVAPILRDVADGILRAVSVGYKVHKFEEDQGSGNKMPVRTAVDWEPFEVSLVPMPADVGAKVRAEDKGLTNLCVIVPKQQPPAITDADRIRNLRFALAIR